MKIDKYDVIEGVAIIFFVSIMAFLIYVVICSVKDNRVVVRNGADVVIDVKDNLKMAEFVQFYYIQILNLKF